MKRYLSVIAKNLAILFLAIILAALMIEFGHRLYSSIRPPTIFDKSYMELALAQGWSIDEAQKHVISTSEHDKLKYYDYYLYSIAPGKSENIEFTSYFSARATPDSLPLKDAKKIIWMFGGSTLQNLETTDQLSIANTVAKALNPTERVAVLNFGVGSFQSTLELTKFMDLLRRVKPSEYPKVAIFYDGFNDSLHSFRVGAGNMQGDLSEKLATLVEGHYKSLLMYSANMLMSKYSEVWKERISPRVQRKLFDHPSLENNDAGQAAAVYFTNRRIIEATCKQFKIQCLFVLQPLLVTKTPLAPSEKSHLASESPALIQYTRDFYKIVLTESHSKNDFLDLSKILDNQPLPHFYDFGHTGPLTGIIIGNAIANRIR